jgi:hypothetical protein
MLSTTFVWMSRFENIDNAKFDFHVTYKGYVIVRTTYGVCCQYRISSTFIRCDVRTDGKTYSYVPHRALNLCSESKERMKPVAEAVVFVSHVHYQCDVTGVYVETFRVSPHLISPTHKQTVLLTSLN